MRYLKLCSVAIKTEGNMKKILLTTESCSDLTKEVIDTYEINIAPMHIVFPTESFPDGSIPVQQIYDYFNRTKEVPKTSAVNPSEFTELFDRLAEENPEAEIVHIGYSSECSCTFQNATIGVKDCKKAKVHLVDSKNVSVGIHNLLLMTAKHLEKNPQITPEELVEFIKSYVPKIVTWFVPDRLEYLVAGGRVSNAKAIGATILRLKPRIDIIGGNLIATKKYRGSMTRVAGKLFEDFVSENRLDKEILYTFYAEGADMRAVEILKEKGRAYGFKEIKSFPIGCVMSIHGGPGAVGMSAVRA